MWSFVSGLRGRGVSRSERWLLIGLLAVFLLAIYVLIFSAKPWGPEVAKRLASGAELRPREWGIMGLYWGGAFAGLASAVLLLTCKWWLPSGLVDGSNIGDLNAAGANTVGRRWLYPGLLVICLLGAGYRVIPLQHSLWNDEEYAMRRYAHGEWKEKEDGEWRFVPVAWEDTLFRNNHMNNHLLHSLLARVSLSVWRGIAGRERHEFSEAALRLPSFLAGVLSLFVVGLLMWEMRPGQPVAAWCAAALMALHPWVIRYSCDAKGYSLMLLGVLMALLGLLRAVKGGGLMAWLMLAVGQAVFLLSFAGSIYVALALNGLGLLWFGWRRQWVLLRQLPAFGLLAAIPVLWWTLPSVPQILGYLRDNEIISAALGTAWFLDLGSHVMTGLLRVNGQAELHAGLSWIMMAGQFPGWTLLAAGVLPGIALVGLAGGGGSAGTGARLVLWVPVLAVVLAVIHNVLSEQTPLVWYLLYAVIPLVLALPLGVLNLTRRRPGWSNAALVLMFALFMGVTSLPRHRSLVQDRQPIRQAALRAQELAGMDGVTAVFGVSDRQVLSYDPQAWVLGDADDLRKLMLECNEKSCGLLVYFCGLRESGVRKPDVMELVLDGGLFQKEASFPGTEAMFSYELFRMIQ